MDSETAAATILSCNGAREWASELAALRPFESGTDLFCTADRIWAGLDDLGKQEAFDSHPRIGERKAAGAATGESLRWSSQEQTISAEEATAIALAEGNRAYEEKFGRIFIVCATGKTQEEMLEILQKRLKNDAVAEWNEAAEQQRQITQLRLRKWLDGR